MNRSKFDLTKFLAKKQTIIKDDQVFEPNFIPEYLVHRENELTLLANHFKSIISKNSIITGKQVIIQGPVGLGKTVVVRQFGLTLENYCCAKSEDNIANLSFFHMNCRRQRSWYLILTSILTQLVPAFPIRGFSVDELLTYLVKILKERNQGLLICLDEIDYLLSETKGHDVLYSLTRHHEGVNHCEQTQISLILVTRNPHFQKFLDPALLSSLSQRVIIFEPYNATKLFDILSLRAQQGLYEEAYSNDILKTIADFAYKNGDARYAIELLWRSAKVAEQEESQYIDFEHIRKAQVSIFPIKQSIITDLTSQLKKVLFALALLLKHEKNRAFVTTNELQNKYNEICKKSQEKPRKQTQFWNYLQKLAGLGLIELQVQNRHQNGKSAGRTTLISISDLPVSDLLLLLDQNC
ncbi:MAG: AAA family ATPase [Candidatus Heimdallarchaeota archaeon]|nr:MAG: AAA family ATPase [Candidatus Heimdallarchaeota archaeon]